ncbi:MAG TPA: dUTP diphosphatase [Firmicutes bacterium]|nr:dUTP diphosphatase [Bacillota bacterium]
MNGPIQVKVKRMRAEAASFVPGYATGGSAGWDLQAAISAPLVIAPGETVMIPTGIALEIPRSNLAGLVFARSGLAAKHGLCLANGVGVIDSDYRGEIFCAMVNIGKKEYTIKPGDRLAQLVFVPVERAEPVFVAALEETERGAGGFGSTGI